MKARLVLSVLVLVFLAACTTPASVEQLPGLVEEDIHPLQQEGAIDYEKELFDLSTFPVRTLNDGTKYVIHPDKILSGGPPKDGIPSIDNPEFVTVQDADEWVEDDELVLFMNYNGVQKAYPNQIMVWHEIINDYAGDIPVAITYCPLCITGIAYNRMINDEVTEFGTSGKLFNSNLVMYDRQTDTYWTQVDGVGIIGELSGEQLVQIPLDVTYWSDIKELYPDAQVLSKDTGFLRQYGRDPYLSYYTDDAVWFPLEFQNFSVDTKEIIYGVEINGEKKAYREKDIEEAPIEDTVGGVMIRLEKMRGVVNTTNKETGEELIEERHFWFSWYAFHPDTTLYERMN